MGTAKGKDNDGKRQAARTPHGDGPEALEEISLAVEPYGDAPDAATPAERPAQPEIYEVDGELLPFDISPDY